MTATCIAVEVTAQEKSVDHADITWTSDLVRCRSRVSLRPRPAPTPPTASLGCREKRYLPVESHSTSSGLVQPGMRSRLRATYPYLLGGRNTVSWQVHRDIAMWMSSGSRASSLSFGSANGSKPCLM